MCRMGEHKVLLYGRGTYIQYPAINHNREENLTKNIYSGGDGIPVELFQILKDDAGETVALNMPANLETSAVATGLEKVSFHSNPK